MIDLNDPNQILEAAEHVEKGCDEEGRPTHWTGCDAEIFENHACEIDWEFLAEVVMDFPNPPDMYKFLIHTAATARDDEELCNEDRVIFCSWYACHALVAVNHFDKI